MKKKQTGKFMAMALTAAMLGGMLAAAETMRQTLLRIRRRRRKHRLRNLQRYRRVRLQRKHPLQAASR